jgi:hypothetical protein
MPMDQVGKTLMKEEDILIQKNILTSTEDFLTEDFPKEDINNTVMSSIIEYLDMNSIRNKDTTTIGDTIKIFYTTNRISYTSNKTFYITNRISYNTNKKILYYE